MSFTGFVLMCLFTIIGVKYLVDMIKYAIGYEINGKCRFGKKYARELLASKKQKGIEKQKTVIKENDIQIHDDISRLIAQLNVN